ncbi:hypothetical protein HF521_020475 [Silurus meridionalis]|uniref:Uncharacterized protein n=1 Tax=Silurus meridionalis TaxID=175797 RepID=A0A8T0BE21_SILME|nr:hypothetical protein HF521_020475 [Silurus meridionalis]
MDGAPRIEPVKQLHRELPLEAETPPLHGHTHIQRHSKAHGRQVLPEEFILSVRLKVQSEDFGGETPAVCFSVRLVF